MTNAFNAKNKLEFVDDSLLQPTPNHALHAAWKCSNNMVVLWLIHSVSPSIRESIMRLDKVVDIWKGLKSRYSQRGLLRISKLQQEVISVKYGDVYRISYKIKGDMG